MNINSNVKFHRAPVALIIASMRNLRRGKKKKRKKLKNNNLQLRNGRLAAVAITKRLRNLPASRRSFPPEIESATVRNEDEEISRARSNASRYTFISAHVCTIAHAAYSSQRLVIRAAT